MIGLPLDPWDKESLIGGSLPDFVVLHFREKAVYVVEVTTSSNIRGILKKVNERKTRWYEPIKNYEASWVDLVKTWDFKVCLFLREQVLEKAKKETRNLGDVDVISIDSIEHPWEWEWSEQNVPTNPL